jgi:uncharacterized protein (DUF488 family)
VVEVVTIGAYGWTGSAFFDALIRERVDVFCDLRRRRGVRGSEYAFVNSARLQGRLKELGFGYQHHLELAPSAAVRQVQVDADAKEGVAKRDRSRLGSAFAAAYALECLTHFSSERFLDEVGAEGPIGLSCVERDPAACHRILVAETLAESGASVKHLLP